MKVASHTSAAKVVRDSMIELWWRGGGKVGGKATCIMLPLRAMINAITAALRAGYFTVARSTFEALP
ncbi:MAG: hypothetical protein C0483_07105 [Pirellula sp.]|nr:hypothetical protein [Pirellula sp.]